MIVNFSKKKRSQNWRRKHVFSWLPQFNMLALWASDYSNRRKRFSFSVHFTLRRLSYLVPNSSISTNNDSQFKEVMENIPSSPLIRFLKHKTFWPVLTNLHFKNSVCTLLLTHKPWSTLPLNLNNHFRLYFYRTFVYSGQNKEDFLPSLPNFSLLTSRLLILWVKEVYKVLTKLLLKLFVYTCQLLKIR